MVSVREAAKARTRQQALEAVGLLELSLSGATDVGDVGLKALGEHCAPTLRLLSLSGASKVSDVGLRCVGLRAYAMTSLDLSGCSGVDGVGLAVFGEASPNLVKLNLSGCRQVMPWAFQRLVCGCHLLEDVDLSRCDKLGDVDVGVMATNCGKIKRLNLRDAKQLSDLALVSVAKRCSALEYLDTSRTELPWKVTDVGLLGLAESCPLLHTLLCQGCDQLTDVAMAWLGRGCKALRHLDLKGCHKIANAGIRALAEGCYELSFLDLTNMKGVTDTGIRALANNCPGLKHLTFNGMYMLTDGKARDFGLEGLQALCNLAREVETLHLAGCFQVSKGALVCIAKSAFARCLRNLSLRECPSLDEASWVRVVKHCPSLDTVCLSHCGECVTEHMVVELARGPARKSLTSLDLTACPNVAGLATKALVKGCRGLVTLNLTDCVKVDDLALVPFSEVSSEYFKPGLESLVLKGCPLVGDTGLAWLADGLSKCNVLMNLKGTRVSSAGLRSVQDRWRYSEPKKSANFLGLWPQKRWKDRVVINLYGKRFKAARRIQSIARGNAGRLRFEAVRRAFYRQWVALRLQCWWRGRIAREVYQMMVWEHERRVHAQTVLVGFSWIIAAKERLRVLRERRAFGIAERACIRLQTRYRMRLAWLLVERLRAEAAERARRLRRSALDVQRAWRGFCGRQRFKAVLAAKIALAKKRDEMARLLQRNWRGSSARRKVAATRRMLADRAALEQRCAVMVQTRFRSHRTARILARAARQRRQMVRAAVKLQSAWRAKCARAFLSMRRLIMQQEAEEAAALTLTCWGRCLHAAEVVAKKRRERDQSKLRVARAALTVQRCYRGHVARSRVRAMKKRETELLRKMIELENWSAVLISSLWRGYAGRCRAHQRMREHKGKWKEMWDPDKRRPFYYNQVSGEIRWRKPQALLDLMRRPICHNCEFYEAVVECQNCIEFYCNSCWETVHYSGKRKRHKFRCLYDYYEKRVDYGDNEFPSRWPSEVEQDEMVGWQLRISDSKLGPSHDRPANEVGRRLKKKEEMLALLTRGGGAGIGGAGGPVGAIDPHSSWATALGGPRCAGTGRRTKTRPTRQGSSRAAIVSTAHQPRTRSATEHTHTAILLARN